MRNFLKEWGVVIFGSWFMFSLLLSMARATTLPGSETIYDCNHRQPITYVIYDRWFCPLKEEPRDAE